jgi:[ribosomal protein S18]-alanine N-acetyltransferase
VTSAPLRIEPLRRRHIPAVTRIERMVSANPWSAELFRGELALPEATRYYRVARRGGRLVGFGGLMFVLDEAHVTTLSVHPDHQGQRIGTRLLAVLVREARARGTKALTLEVRAGNEPAQALYRRFGFAPAGIRKGYYAELGEDALIMWAHDVDADAYGHRLAEIEAGLPPAEVRAA